MKNGRFTNEERDYLISLDAVAEIRSKNIIYTQAFKKIFIEKYKQGEKPSKIFEEAGLSKEIIGYKRIERACARWREADSRGQLGATEAPQVRHQKYIATLKKEKTEAVQKQREIRQREMQRMEEKLKKQKQRAKSREEKIIASQKAEIDRLKAQVKALKANGTFARASKRAPGSTTKSDRFEVILQLMSENLTFNVSAACEILEVSTSGFYEYMQKANERKKRLEEDKQDEKLVLKAYLSHNSKKGSRLVVDNLRREQGVRMSRKKVQRHMRNMKISGAVKRKNPYSKIGADGEPKVADNIVNREFITGEALKVLSTDITYLPCKDKGFVYLSGVIDCETRRFLAGEMSCSLAEDFVLKTLDKLKSYNLSKDAILQSDQGVHYTARAYRDKLRELGIRQSMSRRACCYDNSPIESFWGRMKEQIGKTKHLPADEVIELVNEYIYYYNNLRGQARLQWRTPIEHEAYLLAA